MASSGSPRAASSHACANASSHAPRAGRSGDSSTGAAAPMARTMTAVTSAAAPRAPLRGRRPEERDSSARRSPATTTRRVSARHPDRVRRQRGRAEHQADGRDEAAGHRAAVRPPASATTSAAAHAVPSRPRIASARSTTPSSSRRARSVHSVTTPRTCDARRGRGHRPRARVTRHPRRRVAFGREAGRDGRRPGDAERSPPQGVGETGARAHDAPAARDPRDRHARRDGCDHRAERAARLDAAARTFCPQRRDHDGDAPAERARDAAVAARGATSAIPRAASASEPRARLGAPVRPRRRARRRRPRSTAAGGGASTGPTGRLSPGTEARGSVARLGHRGRGCYRTSPGAPPSAVVSSADGGAAPADPRARDLAGRARSSGAPSASRWLCSGRWPRSSSPWRSLAPGAEAQLPTRGVERDRLERRRDARLRGVAAGRSAATARRASSALVRARGASLGAYVRGRVGGLVLVLAAAVGGATLVAGLAATSVARPSLPAAHASARGARLRACLRGNAGARRDGRARRAHARGRLPHASRRAGAARASRALDRGGCCREGGTSSRRSPRRWPPCARASAAPGAMAAPMARALAGLAAVVALSLVVVAARVGVRAEDEAPR